jgi:hypothetical protein
VEFEGVFGVFPIASTIFARLICMKNDYQKQSRGILRIKTGRLLITKVIGFSAVSVE